MALPTTLEQPTYPRAKERLTPHFARLSVETTMDAAAAREWVARRMFAVQCLAALTVAMASWQEMATTPHAPLFAGLEWIGGGASRHPLALAVFGIVLAIAIVDIDTAGIAAVLLYGVSICATVTLALERQSPLVSLATAAAACAVIWQRRNELREFLSYALGRPCERLHVLCPEDDLPPKKEKPLRDNDALLG